MLRFGFFAGFRSFTGRERLAGVVAMLHDVLEDADEEALAPVASWLSDEEAEALRLLTRERGSYDEYVERIATAGNRIAVLVKRRAGAGQSPAPAHGAAAYRGTGTARAPEAGLPSPRPASAPRKLALRRSPAPARAAPAPVSPGHWLGRSPRFRGFSAAKLDPGHP